MAAATCLALLAECVKDDVFAGGIIMAFVEQNISSSDWRGREAAVMAFGSVMDGPRPEAVGVYIQQGFPVLINMMGDSSVAVRDTTAWAIGRVIDFMTDLVSLSLFESIIAVLTKGLADAPRVAVNCCWSLMSLFVHLGDDSSSVDTSPLSPFLESVASALFMAAQRPNADESNLRSAAYQSLANVVLFAPTDCIPSVSKLQQVMLVKLSDSQRMADEIVNIDDRIRYSELQSNLCTVLQNSVKKIGKPSLLISDQMMSSLILIFHNAGRGRGSATELEDAFLLVGTLISEMEGDFVRFVESFIPFLYAAIRNHAEYHLCTVAIGVVGDLARALNQTLLPYCNELMGLLLQALQDGQLARDVKPHVVSAIGDIALSIGGSFVNYLQPTMHLFAQASLISVEDQDDYDEIDFVCLLRESLLEAYTGIVQGLKDDQQGTPPTPCGC